MNNGDANPSISLSIDRVMDLILNDDDDDDVQQTIAIM